MALSKIHAKRDLEMFEAMLNSDSYGSLSKRYNLTKTRCQQIIRKVVRTLISPINLQEDEIPEHDWFYAKELRMHKDFWIAQANKLKARFGIK